MFSAGESFVINQNLNSNFGIDLGLSRFGISSKGLNAGASYKSTKLPLQYRAQFRYSKYKMTESDVWTNIVRCTIAINWQFKYKLQNEDQPKK
jgi:hypothetical protein